METCWWIFSNLSVLPTHIYTHTMLSSSSILFRSDSKVRNKVGGFALVLCCMTNSLGTLLRASCPRICSRGIHPSEFKRSNQWPRTSWNNNNTNNNNNNNNSNNKITLLYYYFTTAIYIWLNWYKKIPSLLKMAFKYTSWSNFTCSKNISQIHSILIVTHFGNIHSTHILLIVTHFGNIYIPFCYE